MFDPLYVPHVVAAVVCSDVMIVAAILSLFCSYHCV